jgi:very-short-patch-repair endonuclease
MPKQRSGRREIFRQKLVERAREMRTQMPAAELRLWSKLRGDQINGLRFRRQHRIGSYLADFYCHAAKLAIELDGDSHDERREYDEKRTYWINQSGIEVIRFTNDDVMRNLVSVIDVIAARCSSAANPSPLPSPRRTGKRE